MKCVNSRAIGVKDHQPFQIFVLGHVNDLMQVMLQEHETRTQTAQYPY
jgi:hypothetical protein